MLVTCNLNLGNGHVATLVPPAPSADRLLHEVLCNSSAQASQGASRATQSQGEATSRQQEACSWQTCQTYTLPVCRVPASLSSAAPAVVQPGLAVRPEGWPRC